MKKKLKMKVQVKVKTKTTNNNLYRENNVEDAEEINKLIKAQKRSQNAYIDHLKGTTPSIYTIPEPEIRADRTYKETSDDDKKKKWKKKKWKK